MHELTAAWKHTFRGVTVDGWIDPPELEHYNRLVSMVHNGLVVEVGVYAGLSLLGIYDTCQRNGNRLVGVDSWTEEYGGPGADERYRDLVEIVDALKIEVAIIHSPSVEAAKSFGNEVDFVFIDADHHYEPVRDDIAAWWPKVKPGGYMAGHDYCEHSPGVIQAVDEFCAENCLVDSHFRWIWCIRKPQDWT